MKKYYIAYGSNLNVQQMSYSCPGARVVGISVIKGYELIYKGSKTGSYLTIEKKKGGIVPVAVWEVTADDEKRLDAYEGYPNFYYKTEMKLQLKGARKRIKAFVYIMHEERKLGIPSTFYMQTCIEGYHNFSFNLDSLFEAYRYSKEGM